MPSTAREAFGMVLRWWPVAISIFALLVAAIEVRVQVRSLIQDQAGERAQWDALASLSADMAKIQDWRGRMEQISSPSEVQFWGYVKRKVPEMEADVDELQVELARRKLVIDEYRGFKIRVEERLREQEAHTHR